MAGAAGAAAEALGSTTDGGMAGSVDEAGSDDEGVDNDSGRRLAEVSGEGAGVGAEAVAGTAAGGATVVDDMCARTGAQTAGGGRWRRSMWGVGENGRRRAGRSAMAVVRAMVRIESQVKKFVGLFIIESILTVFVSREVVRACDVALNLTPNTSH